MPDPVNLALGLSVDGGGQRPPAVWAPKTRRWLPSPPWSWPPWHPRCLGCGERGADGRDLCPACNAALPRTRVSCVSCGLPIRSPTTDLRCDACRRTPPPLTHVVAPFLYGPPLDRWLPRFKFHRDLAAGRLLSQLMLEACAAAPRPDALVPVPLHRTRLRNRGYDQALELAKPLADALGLPVRTDLLARTRVTSAQSSLQAADRHRNLCRAFSATSAARRCQGALHITLVDDVMTTGATLHAAAIALLEAGIIRVDAWICARTPT